MGFAFRVWRCLALGLVALGLSSLALAAEPIAPAVRYALVIGQEFYAGNGLSGAATDARRVAQTLAADGFSVRLMLNAHRESFVSALSELRDRSFPPGSLILIYYSGHGAISARDLSIHWFPLESTPDGMSEASLASDSWNLSAWLESLPSSFHESRLWVISDACLVTPSDAPLDLSLFTARSRRNPTSLLLTSTLPGRVSSDAFAGSLASGGLGPFAESFLLSWPSLLISLERDQNPSQELSSLSDRLASLTDGDQRSWWSASSLWGSPSSVALAPRSGSLLIEDGMDVWRRRAMHSAE